MTTGSEAPTPVLDVIAPTAGQVIDLADVPDPVFSAALVGPGAAIDPERSANTQALAPVTGTLVKLHPHAFIIRTSDGAGILTHLGIDTVQLNGDGFQLHAAEGDEVAAGAVIVSWDPATVETGGRSPIVPVIALDASTEALTARHEPGPIKAGDVLFQWSR